MALSVGRIVHYVAYGTSGGEYKAGAHRAAMITEVHSHEYVNLVVFNPTGLHYVFSVRHAEPADIAEIETTPGTWHWPERVE